MVMGVIKKGKKKRKEEHEKRENRFDYQLQ
jgi:hypothetical protein